MFTIFKNFLNLEQRGNILNSFNSFDQIKV